MRKSVLYNWGFWALLGMNGYIVYYYSMHPNSYSTIVALYWVQSVCIGIFNFLSLITFPNTNSKITLSGKTITNKGCFSIFFLVHYGIFHLVYLVFILIDVVKIDQLNWRFLKAAVIIIIASTAINFIQDKIKTQKQGANYNTMFMMPYARIVPMHLMILLPKFFNISAPYLFLILKTLADVLMYFVYQKWLFKQGNTNNSNL
ncbi:MAG: hypothetical protein JST94_01455 [Bacteroidetes bacterium]|nr:hypothetical protein [Bacteroidota bacterium]MBS1670120.1 hypothetical protein [Bacteroidota bacterium]